VTAGQRLLVRISNVSTTRFYTVMALGLPMEVVAQGAKELTEKYRTSSVNLGGGESFDVIIDTQGVAPGRYFMYITELDELSNNQQSFSGAMTEIVVKAPAI
jgi:FtsP/CotA-like multicopper oxidase with cupredoxin domain